MIWQRGVACCIFWKGRFEYRLIQPNKSIWHSVFNICFSLTCRAFHFHYNHLSLSLFLFLSFSCVLLSILYQYSHGKPLLLGIAPFVCIGYLFRWSWHDNVEYRHRQGSWSCSILFSHCYLCILYTLVSCNGMFYIRAKDKESGTDIVIAICWWRPSITKLLSTLGICNSYTIGDSYCRLDGDLYLLGISYGKKQECTD